MEYPLSENILFYIKRKMFKEKRPTKTRNER
jgi:hypothetical protein